LLRPLSQEIKRGGERTLSVIEGKKTVATESPPLRQTEKRHQKTQRRNRANKAPPRRLAQKGARASWGSRRHGERGSAQKGDYLIGGDYERPALSERGMRPLQKGVGADDTPKRKSGSEQKGTVSMKGLFGKGSSGERKPSFPKKNPNPDGDLQSPFREKNALSGGCFRGGGSTLFAELREGEVDPLLKGRSFLLHVQYEKGKRRELIFRKTSCY